MNEPKISKEVSDLLDPDWAKSDAGSPVVLKKKPDPAKTPKELDNLLTPLELLDVPDPAAGTIGELVPDELRTPDDDAEDELQTKAKTPTEKESDGQKEISLSEWIAKQAKEQDEKSEKEKDAIERENEEIKKSFRRLDDERKVNDLTPDHYKDQE